MLDTPKRKPHLELPVKNYLALAKLAIIQGLVQYPDNIQLLFCKARYKVVKEWYQLQMNLAQSLRRYGYLEQPGRPDVLAEDNEGIEQVMAGIKEIFRKANLIIHECEPSVARTKHQTHLGYTLAEVSTLNLVQDISNTMEAHYMLDYWAMAETKPDLVRMTDKFRDWTRDQLQLIIACKCTEPKAVAIGDQDHLAHSKDSQNDEAHVRAQVRKQHGRRVRLEACWSLGRYYHTKAKALVLKYAKDGDENGTSSSILSSSDGEYSDNEIAHEPAPAPPARLPRNHKQGKLWGRCDRYYQSTMHEQSEKNLQELPSLKKNSGYTTNDHITVHEALRMTTPLLGALAKILASEQVPLQNSCVYQRVEEKQKAVQIYTTKKKDPLTSRRRNREVGDAITWMTNCVYYLLLGGPVIDAVQADECDCGKSMTQAFAGGLSNQDPDVRISMLSSSLVDPTFKYSMPNPIEEATPTTTDYAISQRHLFLSDCEISLANLFALRMQPHSQNVADHLQVLLHKDAGRRLALVQKSTD